MYILIDVYERDINVVRTYDEGDLELAKRDLRERLRECVDVDRLAEGEEWGIELDGTGGWVNTPSANVDLVIKRV